MADFKAGDNVQLKAGGPTMTVNFIENDEGTEVAGCTWFVKDEKKGSRFPTVTLKKVA